MSVASGFHQAGPRSGRRKDNRIATHLERETGGSPFSESRSIALFPIPGRNPEGIAVDDGGTFVNLRAPGNAINGVVSSANSTTIIGNFTIPAGAATGSYRPDVYTVGGGINSRMNAFTVSS